MPKVKIICGILNEETLLETKFPRFVIKPRVNIDDMIEKYGLEKCRYIFVTKKYLFIVNFNFYTNF